MHFILHHMVTALLSACVRHACIKRLKCVDPLQAAGAEHAVNVCIVLYGTYCIILLPRDNECKLAVMLNSAYLQMYLY